VVGSLPISEATEAKVTSMMVGRELRDYFGARRSSRGPVMVSVRGLSDGNGIRDISFDVHSQEIVGLAGLVGAGRTELLRMLFGLHRIAAGEIQVNGRPVLIQKPRDAIAHGFALVPQDRRISGLVPILSVRHNLAMAAEARIMDGFVVRKQQERELARAFVDRLRIKTSSLEAPVRLLSGGNQQKVVVGKWMAVNPRVWLLDEPTRGIDVGAKAEIYGILRGIAGEGVAIVLISSEVPELIMNAERVLVLRGGRISGELRGEAMTESEILGRAMAS
jgi:ribose transport system ATP-binding protein